MNLIEEIEKYLEEDAVPIPIDVYGAFDKGVALLIKVKAELLKCEKEDNGLTDTNADLARQFDELRDSLQKREWISVEDQVPNYSDTVLLFVDMGNDCDSIVTTGFYDHRAEKYHIYDASGTGCEDGVTYWMESPSPPQDNRQ